MGVISSAGVVDNEEEIISSSAAYDSAKNYITSQTDNRGNTTRYTVNSANGLVSKISSDITVNGEDTSCDTEYTYDSDTRMLTQVKSSTAQSTINYTYDTKRRISGISVGQNNYNNNYTFNYDDFGNTLSTKVGYTVLSTASYGSNARKGLINEFTYGNGDKINYQYDNFDRLTVKMLNGLPILQNVYNNKGQLARLKDGEAKYETDYNYDLSGRLISSVVSGSRTTKINYTYDNQNRLKEQTSYIGSESIGNSYTYGKDGLLKTSYQGVLNFDYTYDHLNRLTCEKANLLDGSMLVNTYGYIEGTNLISTNRIWKSNSISKLITYTYDKSGNISTVKENGSLVSSYYYDSLGQLTRENDYKNQKTIVYTYVRNGDIHTITEYPLTEAESPSGGTVVFSATYGDGNNADILASYNNQFITYDDIGNPLNYRDGMVMTWESGRRLSSLQNGNNVVSYQYSADGLRISKTVNGQKTNYYYDDAGRLVRMGDGYDAVWFYYNPSGTATSIKYHNTRYYYVKNIQGDVIAITDPNGNIVANYEYNSWGKLLSITDANGANITSAGHIALVNPLRYRSYFYDSETRFYYLTTRYYDPMICRFINCDGYVSTGTGVLGFNMFAYCDNNPVNYNDHTGTDPVPAWANNILYGTPGPSDINAALNADADAWAGFAHYKVVSAKEKANILNYEICRKLEISAYSEHKNKGTTNPAHKNKHQNAEARRQRDKGGEKGDARRTSRSNKRTPQKMTSEANFEYGFEDKILSGAIVISGTILIAGLVFDDALIAGIADNAAIGALCPIVWDNFLIVLS